MNPDHFGNRETESWDWKELLQEDTEYTLLDGANGMPNQYLFQSQFNDMAGASNRAPTRDDPRDRKKRIDKAYRARCREDQKKQEQELEKLAVENAGMKAKYESLVKEKVTILSPKLESAAIEINQLQSESHNLKRTSDNQRILLHAFTEKMDCPDKLKSLSDEVARLRENVILDPRMQEKKKLLEERLRFENENRLLELQNQAYCMMLQNDRHSRGDEAD